MFNKLKMAIPGGNKKQRALQNKEALAEEKFVIRMVKVEIEEGYYVGAFIKSSSDDDKLPNYLLRQAMTIPNKMNKEVEKEKINYLLSKKIRTEISEDENGNRIVTFSKMEQPKQKESI